MSVSQKISGTVGFLGFGNMGGAVARGIVGTGHGPIRTPVTSADRISIFDPVISFSNPPLPGSKLTSTSEEIFRTSDIILVAVKPQVFRETAGAWHQHVSDLGNVSGKTVVSVMAGIRAATLRETFPGLTCIRVMPNLGLSVGEGASAIATDGLSEESLRLAETIFRSCGTTVRVTEDLIDAVTGVSGSGPMYVFEFVEALTQAGVNSGLEREVAYRLALQTVKGSAKILETSDDAPQTWSARVRSPGGTTAEAQKVLEARGFHAILREAVEAAVRRSRELSG